MIETREEKSIIQEQEVVMEGSTETITGKNAEVEVKDEEVLTDKEEGRSAWFTTTATTLHVNVTHLTIGCPSTRELKWLKI